MNRRKAWKTYSRWAAGGLLLALSGGCSFFYDLNSNQCERPSDCWALGPAFADSICVDRVCVPDDGGNGGTGNNAGTSGGGNTGGGGTNGGTSGTAGSAGSGGMPECTTNSECIEAHSGIPYICREEVCRPVISQECPYLIPAVTEQWDSSLEALEQDDPIILGAYATLDETVPKDVISILSWEYALTEINEATSGGPVVDRARRPVLAVVCSATADIETTMDHMVRGLGVPGILSALQTEELITAFQTDAFAEAEPLVISSLTADNQLAVLQDRGRIWHMLGDPRTAAAPVVALSKRAEVLMQGRRNANPTVEDDPTTPIRMLLVRSTDGIVGDIADVLVSPTEAEEERPQNNLALNDLPAWDLGNENYFATVEVPSINDDPTPDMSEFQQAVRDLKPHVIVLMTTGEMVGENGINWVENQWNAATDPIAPGQQRPFYVLSHRMLIWESSVVGVASGHASRQLPSRLAGVNFAVTSDPNALVLQREFADGIRAANPNSQHEDILGDTENFYDGAYYMAYSAYGSLSTGRTLDGGLLLNAFESRLIDSRATMIANVGRGTANDIITGLLGSTYAVQLRGTQGLPNFNNTFGTRYSEMSSWCVERNAGNTAWVRKSDASRYDDRNHVFTSDFSCIPDL